MNVLLWVVYPYLCIAALIGGTIWRYRYDKFGWTTRSSQLYENRLLRLGSPLFHFGILFVALGHVGGVLIPKSWTEAVGISETVYHVLAVGLGVVAGAMTLVGAAILVYRRRTVGPVFSATLPPLVGRDEDAVARLAAAGPPEEEVGLAPYMPATSSPGGAR